MSLRPRKSPLFNGPNTADFHPRSIVNAKACLNEKDGDDLIVSAPVPQTHAATSVRGGSFAEDRPETV